jgi:hypothetical protein
MKSTGCLSCLWVNSLGVNRVRAFTGRGHAAGVVGVRDRGNVLAELEEGAAVP